jgi:hypothetical protein
VKQGRNSAANRQIFPLVLAAARLNGREQIAGDLGNSALTRKLYSITVFPLQH